MKRNVYTCTTFTGHYPVGTAAVIAAPSQEVAAEMLNSELQLRGLPGDAKPEDMILYPVDDNCRILTDGNY